MFRRAEAAVQQEIKYIRGAINGTDKRYQELQQQLADAQARGHNSHHQVLDLQGKLAALSPVIDQLRETQDLCDRLINERANITPERLATIRAQGQTIATLNAQLVELEAVKGNLKEILNEVLDAHQSPPPSYDVLMANQYASVKASSSATISGNPFSANPFEAATPSAPTFAQANGTTVNVYVQPTATARPTPTPAPAPVAAPRTRKSVDATDLYVHDPVAEAEMLAKIQAKQLAKKQAEQAKIHSGVSDVLETAQAELAKKQAKIDGLKLQIQSGTQALADAVEAFLSQTNGRRIQIMALDGDAMDTDQPTITSSQAPFPTTQAEAENLFVSVAKNKALAESVIGKINTAVAELKKEANLTPAELKKLTNIPTTTPTVAKYACIGWNEECKGKASYVGAIQRPF